MLIAANLPMFFWPAAAATAARLKNILPATGLPDGKTPHEVLHGKPPKQVELKPFGCTAWAMTPAPQRNGKFSPKSHPCVYLGPAFTGASRLWDPVRKVEVVEHSVAFDVNGDAPALLRQAGIEHATSREQDISAFDEGTAPPITTAPPQAPAPAAPAGAIRPGASSRDDGVTSTGKACAPSRARSGGGAAPSFHSSHDGGTGSRKQCANTIKFKRFDSRKQ
ncbi:hypothetical protein CF327_g4809 [Tilletia walkeri]|nr:hypothetical protein CF327_g4809 [Tilletia walkeri]